MARAGRTLRGPGPLGPGAPEPELSIPGCRPLPQRCARFVCTAGRVPAPEMGARVCHPGLQDENFVCTRFLLKNDILAQRFCDPLVSLF